MQDMVALLTPAELDVEAGRLLRLRIRTLLEQLGVTAKSISIKAGLGEGAVNDILRGKSKAPSFQTVAAIARALDSDLGYLTGSQSIPKLSLQELPTEPIPVTGIVETGVFRIPMNSSSNLGQHYCTPLAALSDSAAFFF